MKKILLTMLGVVILLLALLASFIYALHRPPSTEDMHNYFTYHEESYEKINGALLSRLRAGETIDVKSNEKIGFSRVEATLDPFPAVHYYTHFRGMGSSIFGTGIAYLEQEPENLYDNIEAMRDAAEDAAGFRGYGRLTEHWYYFYWEAE